MTTGDDLRGLMRLWPHGVSILSVDIDGDRMGVTVSSLVSLSLEPPLVGVSIGKEASCYELLRAAGRLRGQPPRLGSGGNRAPVRRRPAADRPLGGRRDARGRRRAAHRGRARLDRGARRRTEPDVGDHTFFVAEVLVDRARPVARTRSSTGSTVPPACDRRRRLRPRRRADRVGGGLGRGARALRPRARRALRRRGAARDDGHARARVVALPARGRRRSRTRRRQINAEVVERMLDAYRERSAARGRRGRRRAAGSPHAFPLAVASSSNRPLIDAVLAPRRPRRLLPGDRLLGGGRARASRHPTSTSRPRAGSASRPSAAPRSRTRTAASARRTPRACASSRSRTRAIRPTPRRSLTPTSCSVAR